MSTIALMAAFKESGGLGQASMVLAGELNALTQLSGLCLNNRVLPKNQNSAQKIRSDLGIARLWPEALQSPVSCEIGCSAWPIRFG